MSVTVETELENSSLVEVELQLEPVVPSLQEVRVELEITV